MCCVIPLQCPLEIFGKDFYFLSVLFGVGSISFGGRGSKKNTSFIWVHIHFVQHVFFYKNGIAFLPLLTWYPPPEMPCLSRVPPFPSASKVHLPPPLSPLSVGPALCESLIVVQIKTSDWFLFWWPDGPCQAGILPSLGSLWLQETMLVCWFSKSLGVKWSTFHQVLIPRE